MCSFLRRGGLEKKTRILYYNNPLEGGCQLLLLLLRIHIQVFITPLYSKPSIHRRRERIFFRGLGLKLAPSPPPLCVRSPPRVCLFILFWLRRRLESVVAVNLSGGWLLLLLMLLLLRIIIWSLWIYHSPGSLPFADDKK